MWITAKGLSPFSIRCKLGLLINFGFIYEQWTQANVNLHMSYFMVGHYTIECIISNKSLR